MQNTKEIRESTEVLTPVQLSDVSELHKPLLFILCEICTIIIKFKDLILQNGSMKRKQYINGHSN